MSGVRSCSTTGTAAVVPHTYRVEVVHLLVSSVHRYAGRPRDGAAPLPDAAREDVDEVHVVTGVGVPGDRYAGQRVHADAALTVMAVEALEAVAAELGVAPFDPQLARRTVVLRGAQVEALRGVDFTLDTGSGPVLLGGRRPGGAALAPTIPVGSTHRSTAPGVVVDGGHHPCPPPCPRQRPRPCTASR